jgi:hypothetical protein
LRDVGHVLAFVGDLESGRLDLLFELGNLVVDLLTGTEADASTSVLLLLDEPLDFGVVAIELVLLSALGSLVLRLLSTNRLLFINKDLEAVVGGS